MPWQTLGGFTVTHETRFSFSALWWSARRRLWIEKVKRSKLVCYPEKTNILPWQVSCGSCSRAKRVFTFSTYEEVPEGGLQSKKWREANLFVIPRKRSWDLRQCKLTLFFFVWRIAQGVSVGWGQVFSDYLLCLIPLRTRRSGFQGRLLQGRNGEPGWPPSCLYVHVHPTDKPAQIDIHYTNKKRLYNSILLFEFLIENS